MITVIDKDMFSTELITTDKRCSIESIFKDSTLMTKICTKTHVISLRKRENLTQSEAISEHRRIVDEFKKILSTENIGMYVQRISVLLEEKDYENAFVLLKEVRFFHPENPYLLSLDGYLTCLYEKKYREGIELCKKAIRNFSEQKIVGKEFFLPFFYLNLGKAYRVAGNKRLAVDCFFNALKIDPEHKKALKELSELGIRKRPIIPFLKRSNPINKYLGLLRSKLKTNKPERPSF